MKNLTKLLYCNVTLLLLLLFGCAEDSKEEVTNEMSNHDSKVEADARDPEEETTNEASDNDSEKKANTRTLEETKINDIKSNGNSSKEKVNEEQKDSSNIGKEGSELSRYSSKQIEYARVWLQLGPNQEIDNLYVKQIPKGTPLNPDDDSSIKYPEDVVQLSGSRSVDGVVTYSSNGDGTINVYNVPLRWYGGSPPPQDIDKEKVQEEMRNIINNTTKVYIDLNDEEKVLAGIKKIKIN